jgi:hypothetical protein
MKKHLLLSIAIACRLLVQAQDYEPIKNLMVLMQFKPAKEKLDIAMQNTQFTAKPEAYILKATLYSWMGTQADVKGTAAGDALLNEADIAFSKFRAMDPALTLLTDKVYENGPINIYSGMYTSGYTDYQNKNWIPGLQKFKKAVEYSDLLINKKLIAIPIDTNVLILAAIVAENAGSTLDAVKYYGRLADAKLTGDGFESVYRYLVNYYFTKKDFPSFEKYKALGKALYPQSEYFSYDKIDFTVGLQPNWAMKIVAMENLLATDPDNAKANQVLGELIYDTLDSPGAKAIPAATFAVLENKMLVVFNKVAAMNPNSTTALLYMGNYFVNRSISIQEAIATSTKKEELTRQYNTTLQKAREPYEKAVAIFAQKTSLTDTEKKQYKNTVAYLSEIYINKGDAVGAKKWSDFYGMIK